MSFLFTSRASAFRNSAILLSDRVIRLVGNSAILLLIARRLGPESFGILSYAQSLIVLATALATFGLPDILVREVIRHPRNADVIYSAAATIRASGSLISVLAIFCLEYFARESDAQIIALTVILSFSLLLQSLEVYETKLHVEGRIAFTALIRFFAFMVSAAIRVCILLYSPTLVALALAIAAEPLISGTLFYFTSRRSRQTRPGRARLATTIVMLLRHSSLIFVRVALISFFMRIDHILIERSLGAVALGHYSAAVRLVELWFLLPSAVMAAAAPSLARIHRMDLSAYNQSFKKILAGLILLSTIAAGGLTVLSAPIVMTLYGDEFAATATILAVYSWSIVFGTIGQVSNNWLVNFRALKAGLVQAGLGAACAFALYPITITAFGLVGAAATFVAVQALTNVASNGLLRVSRPLLWLQLRALDPRHLRLLAKTMMMRTPA